MCKIIKIVIEYGEDNYSAYCPQILGCVSTGDTVEKTLINMAGALSLHLEEDEKHIVEYFVNDTDLE